MEPGASRRNIAVFCVYRFMSRFYMYLPILAVVLYKFGLSFIEIGFVIAVHGLSLMLFKVPLGRLARNVSSNKSIIFTGELLKSLGVLGLGFSQGDLLLLAIAQLFSGMGFALTSSTESNLLFTAMKADGAESDYRRIEAKSQGYGFLSIMISGIIGSVVAARSVTLALYLTAPFCLLAAATILLFREHKTEAVPDEKIEAERGGPGAVINYLLFYAVNRALILTIFVFVLPLFLLLSYNLDLMYFGAILSLFSLTGFMIANNFEKISGLLGKKQLWVATPMALLLALGLLLLDTRWVLAAIPVLLSVSATLVRPLTMGKVFALVGENSRHVVSLGEQLFGLLNAAFLILLGCSFSYLSLKATIYLTGSLVVLANLSLLVAIRVRGWTLSAGEQPVSELEEG